MSRQRPAEPLSRPRIRPWLEREGKFIGFSCSVFISRSLHVVPALPIVFFPAKAKEERFRKNINIVFPTPTSVSCWFDANISLGRTASGSLIVAYILLGTQMRIVRDEEGRGEEEEKKRTKRRNGRNKNLNILKKTKFVGKKCRKNTNREGNQVIKKREKKERKEIKR